MNLMGVLLLSLAMNTWAQTIFQLGCLPRLGRPPHLANVTALPSSLANLAHIGPSEPPSGTLFGAGPSRARLPSSAAGTHRQIKQFFSVIQCTASKGDFQWSAWVHSLVI